MSIEPKDWTIERERLKEVAGQIAKQLEGLEDIVRDRRETVVSGRRNFWDDITVNVENEDEEIETAASITQQANVQRQQEIAYRHAFQTLRRLEKLQGSPYFGRIDFTERGGASEAVYVGIQSLTDEESGEIYIYDWRAPISGMFYDYPPGPAEYETPVGPVQGELTLKRQYVIRQGEIRQMFDTGLPIGDDVLREMLGQSADDKMKSIVTTIQKEQNEIIRTDRHRILIVQGAAGSGKTSVALQRVAYLLYKYRNVMSSENILLFSPNRLFNDYISTVLPELGEANMRQTTFQDYLAYTLGFEWKLENPYERMELVLGSEEDDAWRARTAGMAYKASTDFFGLIRRYLTLLKQEGMLFKTLSIRDKTVIPAERLVERFYGFEPRMSIEYRIEKMRRWLLDELEEKEEAYAKAVYRKMYANPRYLGTEPEMKAESRRKARRTFTPLVEMADRLEFADALGLYKRLFTDPELLQRLLAEEPGAEAAVPGVPAGAGDAHGLGASAEGKGEAAKSGGSLPPEWEGICRYTLEALERGEMPYEDATPYVYLQAEVEGMQKYREMRHVLIDEAQDYSPFQYAYIRALFPKAGFTLLGDLNQGIQGEAGLQGYEGIRELLGGDEAKTVRLFKSYRSTRQIVDFTKALLGEGQPVEAFSRDGELPRLIRAQDESALADAVAADVRSLRAEGASVAVLCHTAEESEQAFAALQQRGETDAVLITRETETFVTGTVVLPVYLAKGLEFDAVVVYEAGSRRYGRERERKLLYTACTRALHRLHLYYTGEPSPFLAGVPGSLFERQEA